MIDERSQMTSGNHAATLLPLIETILAAAGWSVSHLDAIAVSVGPGSFTGLRVGLSVAKGLAWTVGCPVVAIPTLEALAHCAPRPDRAVAAVLDARKGELYAAIFRFEGPRCVRHTDDALLRPEDLLGQLPLPCTIIGDATDRYGDWLRERLGAAAEVMAFPEHGPRGAVVATLGHERLGTHAEASLASLEPLYIRPPEATVRHG